MKQLHKLGSRPWHPVSLPHSSEVGTVPLCLGVESAVCLGLHSGLHTGCAWLGVLMAGGQGHRWTGQVLSSISLTFFQFWWLRCCSVQPRLGPR